MQQHAWLVLAQLARRWDRERGPFGAYLRASLGWALTEEIRTHSHASRSERVRVYSVTHEGARKLSDGRVRPGDFAVSAHCNRVLVEDGHMEAVSVALKSKASVEDLREAWREFRALPQERRLPSAPAHPIVVREEKDRPQPKFDLDTERGMATVIGRVRPCPVLQFKYMALSHNTIRGAAGAALLNAELMKSEGYLD